MQDIIDAWLKVCYFIDWECALSKHGYHRRLPLSFVDLENFSVLGLFGTDLSKFLRPKLSGSRFFFLEPRLDGCHTNFSMVVLETLEQMARL